MSENVTFEAVVGEGQEILYDVYDYEYSAKRTREYIHLIHQVEKCCIPFLIVIGVPCNILAFLILIRRRLWLHQEAYIYLGAVLIVNVTTLIVIYGDYCLTLFDEQLVSLSISSDIICKLWGWILHVNAYTNWLPVLMLLNVYLRQQLITSSDRRGCYTNLSAKYCTIFGTKVVICSFFTVCVVSSFWGFSGFSLEHYYDNWNCYFNRLHYAQHEMLSNSLHWMAVISIVIILPVLLLVVWKRWRSSGFVFSQMNGATEDNGDAEANARIIVFCSAAVFALKVPLIFNFIVHVFNLGFISNTRIIEALLTLHIITFAQPLSTPIVCFALKSRFRDELRAIVDRCCYRCCPEARHHRTLPIEADIDRSSILQMDPIEEDLPVTRREEDSESIRR